MLEIWDLERLELPVCVMLRVLYSLRSHNSASLTQVLCQGSQFDHQLLRWVRWHGALCDGAGAGIFALTFGI